MTDDERAALVRLIAETIYASRKGVTLEIAEVRADKVIAAIEPAIRADERARVVAEATADEAVERARRAHAAGWQGDMSYDMRATIRAALGQEDALREDG